MEQYSFENIQPNELWANKITLDFIKNLSFDGYILAGHSVTNLVTQTKIKGDLDFWVTNPIKYKKALSEMYPFYSNFNIYPSMIEMFNSDDNSDDNSESNIDNLLPKINLIYTSCDPFDTINRFDFDYCRCYWTPTTGLVSGFGFKEAIQTKIIKHPASYVNNRRIIKAINYGYTFTNIFWFERSELFKSGKFNVKIRQGHLFDPLVVDIQNLDPTHFNHNKLVLDLTDISNVSNTLEEICTQLRSKFKIVDVLIPVLISIDKKDSVINNTLDTDPTHNLILEYVDSIILLNPLSDSNYLEFKIGSFYINLKDKSISENHCIQPNEIDPDFSFDSDELEEQYDEELEEESESDKLNSNQRIICPGFISQTIKLNESGSAFIRIDNIPDELKLYLFENFNTMWNLHPENKHKIIMYEKEVEVNRYSQSYLNTPTDLEITKTHSYMYSGFDTSNNNIELPEQFKKVYDHITNIDSKYNQVIANWYTDHNDFIAPHSDCQKCMIPDASISIVSIYPRYEPEKFRYLNIIPKKSSKKSIIKIRLDHGSIITMGGTIQEEFLHGIDKCDNEVLQRISLSFRQMI